MFSKVKSYKNIVVSLLFVVLMLSQICYGDERETLSDDIIGYWAIDEGSGDIIYDKTGRGNNCELKGGTQWVKGDSGSALEFDGNNGQIVISKSNGLNSDSEITVTAWVKPEDINGRRAIVNYGPAIGWMTLQSNDYQLLVNDGRLEVLLRTEQNPGWLPEAEKPFYVITSDTTVFKSRTWTYVGFTYSVTQNKLVLYFNGRPIKEVPADGKIKYCSPSSPFGIGGILGVWYAYQFNGFIRDVKVYNRALSPEEIGENYQINKEIAKLKVETTLEKIEKRLVSEISAEIIDSETGKRTDARVYVKGSDGFFYFPQSGFNYGNYNYGFFYAFEGFKVPLPPGKVEIIVVKGFEFSPVRLNIELKEGEKKSLKIMLTRMINLSKKGWYSGEHHKHFGGVHGKTKYSESIGMLEASRICRAEGMNYCAFAPKGDFEKDDIAFEDFIGDADCEGGSGIGGHICYINIDMNNPGFEQTYYNNTSGISKFLELGGVSIYTHPYYGDIDNDKPEDNCFARELPVSAVLCKHCVWDILYAGMPDAGNDTKEIIDWYRYLNLGIKLIGTSSTDGDLDQAIGTDIDTAVTPGWRRTYLRLSSLTWEEIVSAYKNGRAFFSTGPLILFNIEGKDIGDTVKLSGERPERLKFHIEAYSNNGIEKGIIIKNGIPVRELVPIDDKIKEDFELKVNETCWFAVKVYGKKGDFFFGTFAHTNPIYVQFGDERLKPNKEDVEYFLHWLDKYEDIVPRCAKLWGGSPEEYNEIIRVIKEARKVYQDILVHPRDFR